MPDSNTDEVKESLLARAVLAWMDDPSLGAEVCGEDADAADPGEPDRYLRAYYWRVATEDLASPERMAAVAAAHARLGRFRPQGRALVQIREPGAAHLEAVTPSTVCVDIVIDDMPYLVDSVTTELNRHDADIQLIVHPVLRVRRDVTGALRSILGVSRDDGSAESTLDEAAAGTEILTESWIHVELCLAKEVLTSDELAAHLRRVLDDVRIAVEDHRRMQA